MVRRSPRARRGAPELVLIAGLVASAAPAGAQSVTRPAVPPPPPVTDQVRQLAHGLATAATAHLDSARALVLTAVDDVEADAARRQLVHRSWDEQFASASLEAELAVEIAARFPAADQESAARWSASLPALRLELARALAAAPAAASIDPRALVGEDAERWRLADRLVDVCGLFERGTALLVALNTRASLAALRIVAMPESVVEARRIELEQGLAGQLAANRSALRERALRATFVSNRKAAPEDLAAELDFFASPAGQARCRAQTDALEAVLVRRIDDLPRAVAVAAKRD